MVEILPAAKLDVLQLFDCVAPTNWREHGYLRRAIAEGMCETVTVNVNGSPAWTMGHHDSDDGGLWIDFVHTLNSRAAIENLFDAVTGLAKSRKRTYVRAVISRKGFAEICTREGWQVEGVLMQKKL